MKVFFPLIVFSSLRSVFCELLLSSPLEYCKTSGVIYGFGSVSTSVYIWNDATGGHLFAGVMFSEYQNLGCKPSSTKMKPLIIKNTKSKPADNEGRVCIVTLAQNQTDTLKTYKLGWKETNRSVSKFTKLFKKDS